MTSYPGLFITLEGCEGCGKSTQARLLYNILRQFGLPCILTHEPGGTPLGNKIRDLLKVKRDFHIAAEAELFLFAASRFQLVSDVIRPALSSGKVVVCDRFSDSTFVYQGYGRGLDLKMIEEINTQAVGGLGPDITILLDAEAEIGLGRKHNSQEDRFEAENISFHQKIRNGYLQSAQRQPDRWRVIQAFQPPEEVSRLVWESLLPVLQKKYPSVDLR
ncbi:MAG: dTMP kinase [Dehalococcoidia bacterium]